MTATATPQVPTKGAVVEVRGARWAVADFQEQKIDRSPADERVPELQHVVTLQSLDEDRLGEELTVVWQLEVGHSVQPEQGLPQALSVDGFDDPNTLGAMVDAVRWGAVTSADDKAFQSPFRSGAKVEPYQLEPLRRALAAPRTNLLLADDVGLGKTIEAGLVIQELLLRHRARTVVIVCPPSLALKWQQEMRDKFGLEFTIVNSALMAEVRRTHGLAANPFRLFPRIIVSMAWLPTARPQRLLREIYGSAGLQNSARQYAFDVLVVDEAHHVAPASPSAVGGGRGYAVDSKRTLATKDLAKRCEHRLFLSATPHNGHSESFTALLEMIDDRRFTRGATVDAKALKAVTVRRLKTDIPDKDFKERRVQPIDFEPTAAEQQAFEELTRVLADSAKANGHKVSGDIVGLIIKKRFFSSPLAFAKTMSHYEQIRQDNRFGWDDDLDYDEVLGSEGSDEEEGAAYQPELEALRTSHAADPLSAASPELIGRLVDWGYSYDGTPDSRLTALIGWLDAICRPSGTWSNERVVIFTEYADTLEWIRDILRQKGYDDDILAVIQGSTDAQTREVIRSQFTSPPHKEPVRVLLATDSAGEGIDLQDYCHRLVNFDIPFNPSRLEQRIGRIDRYGQNEHPEIYHFAPAVGSSTYDEDMRFLGRIAEKIGTVAQDLGSANQVIDAQLQERFCPSSRSRSTKIKTDAVNATINETLAGGLELNRQLTELSRTYVDRKLGLHLTPENAYRVLATALDLSAEPPLEEVGSEDLDARVFEVPRLSTSWEVATRGLATITRPEDNRPVTFDEEGAGHKGIVHLHIGHPMMTKAAQLLRNALASSQYRLNKVTAVVVPDLEESCVAAVSRLVLVGQAGLRLHEEVFFTGVRLRGRQLAEEKVQNVLDRALDGNQLSLVNDGVRARLVKEWNDTELRDRLEHAVVQRAERQTRAVDARIKEREEADVARAQEIFHDFRMTLKSSIEKLLAEDQEAGGQLFQDPVQQRQRNADIRTMYDRMESLEAEEDREVASLQQRYADPRPYRTAAAVVFVITERDAREWGAQ